MNELSAQNLDYYKSQLEKGIIPKTYRGLIEYTMSLRTHFIKNFPEYKVGGFYQGYMDMSYFPLVTTSLEKKKLKIAVVLNHNKVCFEIWLSAQNREIIHKSRALLKQAGLNKKYRFTSNPDAIVEFVCVEQPNFKESNAMIIEIENGIRQFLSDLEAVLK